MKTIKYATTLLISLLSVMFLSAQENETPPVSLQLIKDNIYQINGGQGANGGLIVGETKVLVIDSKMTEESVNQTRDAIKKLGDLPITYLVNTHSDGDHIMGNRFFPGSVAFIAQVNCRADFFKENFGRESDWGEPEFYPFTPSISFEDKLDIRVDKEKVELHYFGVGHTTGDIVVYVPSEKVAFIGDLYFSGRPQLIHSIKNGNTFAYVETMIRLLETLDAEVFCSGHSDPVGREEIQKHVLAMIAMQMQVKTMVGEEKSLEEVLKEFSEDQSRLITSIFNEVSEQGPTQSNENPY